MCENRIKSQNAFYINSTSQSADRKALIIQGLLHQFVLLALGGFCDGLYLAEVCDAPLGELIEDRADGAAEIGERILDLWRHLAINVSLDEAERFKLAELLREHLFGGWCRANGGVRRTASSGCCRASRECGPSTFRSTSRCWLRQGKSRVMDRHNSSSY